MLPKADEFGVIMYPTCYLV